MRYNYDTKDFQVAHKLNNEILTFDDYKDQFHIVYEFLLFIEGDLEYVVENKKYKLEPYDLLLIKPGQHHYINFYSTGNQETIHSKYFSLIVLLLTRLPIIFLNIYY